MGRNYRLISCTLAFVALFGIVALVGPGLFAQRLSQGVVTPDDPIWAQEPQEPQPPPEPQPQEPQQQAPQGNDPAAAGRGGGRGGPQGGPRPYNQVITSEARTDEGIFKVHRIREQLFYEIPKAELGKDFLWVTQMKRGSAGAGVGGDPIGNQVVRWELVGNRVLLRLVDYSMVADPSAPIAKAVAAATNPAIVRAFTVAALSAGGDPVIDVTSLFLTDVAELSARGRIGARGMDQSRTFLEKVVSFPENINVEVNQTFTGAGADAGRDGGPARGGMRGSSATIVTSYSMVKLPEKPMMPRLFDERIGYFTRSTY